jgi:hypothetical protein
VDAEWTAAERSVDWRDRDELDRLGRSGMHDPRFQVILDFLSRFDPIGLAAESQVPDEYFPEAAPIAAPIAVRFAQARTAAELRRIIHQVFVALVDPDWAGEEARYEAVARAIWLAESRRRSRRGDNR